MKCKILVAGAGELAAETAARLLAAARCEVVLLDEDGDAARALAGDLAGAAAAAGCGASVRAGSSWDAAAGADVAVVTAGDAAAAARGVAERCPGAVLALATDPVEEACAAALAAGRFPRGRVLGVAGAVEALRLRAGVAQALEVSAADIGALVLGGRGARAVPVLRALRVGGAAVADKLPAEHVARLVAALHSGPAAGPRTVAAATAAVVQAVAGDTRALIPCAVLCAGELGVQDAIAGVPVVLGSGGVRRVVDPALDDGERDALAAAAVPYEH